MSFTPKKGSEPFRSIFYNLKSAISSNDSTKTADEIEKIEKRFVLIISPIPFLQKFANCQTPADLEKLLGAHCAHDPELSDIRKRDIYRTSCNPIDIIPFRVKI